MKTHLHGPIAFAKNVESAIPGGGWIRQNKNVHQQSSGGGSRRTKLPLWRSNRKKQHILRKIVDYAWKTGRVTGGNVGEKWK